MTKAEIEHLLEVLVDVQSCLLDGCELSTQCKKWYQDAWTGTEQMKVTLKRALKGTKTDE
jgi:hypothetical protein